LLARTARAERPAAQQNSEAIVARPRTAARSKTTATALAGRSALAGGCGSGDMRRASRSRRSGPRPLHTPALSRAALIFSLVAALDKNRAIRTRNFLCKNRRGTHI